MTADVGVVRFQWDWINTFRQTVEREGGGGVNLDENVSDGFVGALYFVRFPIWCFYFGGSQC